MRMSGSVGTAEDRTREALLSGGGGRRIGLEVRNVDGGGDDDGVGGKRDDGGILYNRLEQCLCYSPDLRVLDSGAIGPPALKAVYLCRMLSKPMRAALESPYSDKSRVIATSWRISDHQEDHPLSAVRNT